MYRQAKDILSDVLLDGGRKRDIGALDAIPPSAKTRQGGITEFSMTTSSYVSDSHASRSLEVACAVDMLMDDHDDLVAQPR